MDASLSTRLLVSGTDIFALGHYPGNPIYPGVLILEHLCTLGQALAAQRLGGPAQLSCVKRVQYLDAVLPGDVVDLHASVKRQTDGELELALSAVVGDKTKARATVLCKPGARAAAAPCCTLPMDGFKAPALSHRELAQVLPHRYPFLLIDQIEAYEPGRWVRARKLLNRASPLFLHQAPAHYPQGLAIESFGQAGIALFFMSQRDARPLDIVLGSVADAELLADIPFEAVLTVEARIERMLPNAVVFSGEASLGDQVVTRIGNLVAMVDPR